MAGQGVAAVVLLQQATKKLQILDDSEAREEDYYWYTERRRVVEEEEPYSLEKWESEEQEAGEGEEGEAAEKEGQNCCLLECLLAGTAVEGWSGPGELWWLVGQPPAEAMVVQFYAKGEGHATEGVAVRDR